MSKRKTPSLWKQCEPYERRNAHTVWQQVQALQMQLFCFRHQIYYLIHAIWCEVCSWPDCIRLLYTKRLDLCGLPVYQGKFPISHRSAGEFHLAQKLEADRNFHISNLIAISPSASLVAGFLFLAGWDRGAEWGLTAGAKYISDSDTEQMVVAISSETKASHAETN